MEDKIIWVLVLLALALALFLYIQSSENGIFRESFDNRLNAPFTPSSHQKDDGCANVPEFYPSTTHVDEQTAVHGDSTSINQLKNETSVTETPSVPEASESIGFNEDYKKVDYPQNRADNTKENCYVPMKIKPEELLPKDADNQWSTSNPETPGKLCDKNFLDAGHWIGVDTVGQSLRNANQQLRSEPPAPTTKVSPWMMSTIGPDLHRRPLE